MPVHNADIGTIFEGIADLLEIQGGNPFRIRAYRNSARTVGEYHRDLKTLIDQGESPNWTARSGRSAPAAFARCSRIWRRGSG